MVDQTRAKWSDHMLGEGGMGVVYRAQQDQPRRIVALKVLRPGFLSAGALKRFEQESQALGRLHHHGIAQIYEAGTFDAGSGEQPFFAMELIDGPSLLEYVQTTGRSRLRETLPLYGPKFACVFREALRHALVRQCLT